jgi:putative exporter of polyketide antibiotics
MGYNRASRSYGAFWDFVYAVGWFSTAGWVIYRFYSDAHSSWAKALIIAIPVVCVVVGIVYLIADSRRAIARSEDPSIWDNMPGSPKQK